MEYICNAHKLGTTKFKDFFNECWFDKDTLRIVFIMNLLLEKPFLNLFEDLWYLYLKKKPNHIVGNWT